MLSVVFLVLTCVIYVVTLVVQGITIFSRRSAMQLGGKAFMRVNYIMIFVNLTLLALCIVMSIREIGGSASYDPVIIAVTAIGGAAFFAHLRIRKHQYLGMRLALQSTDTVKISHNNIMANVSHEIRTPLNTILGLTEILMHREGITEQMTEDLFNISEAGNTLLSVVNNVIDFSKIESDKLDLIPTDYDTREMITTVIRRAKSMLKNSGVEFLADIDANTPSKLHGDDVRLIQALTNVLSNSCKYTHIGVITFRLSCVRDEDKVLMRFDIEDTGIGMKEDEQRDLFEPFDGVRVTNDRTNKGAGLGLVITKSIIDRMEGKISFTSEEGTGTGFTIEITQQIVDAAPIGRLDEEDGAKEDKRYMFTAPMARVLVVDDNMVNLFVAKELLANYEIDVSTAAGGPECIDMVTNNYYDIIFMDYVMPEMDGHETLLNIRAKDNDYFHNVPIVALTAQIVNAAEKTYLDEGFQGYISKPININELEAVLLQLLPEEYICRKESSGADANEVRLEDKAWYHRFKSVLVDFDLKKGLQYSNNDYTSYLNLLRVIYNDSFTQAGRLKSYLDSSNYDAYRVAVHAMKSVTASAGADKLSFICLEHENAAKSCNGEYIRNHINTLLSEYDVFLREIETLLQRESEMMNRTYSVQKKEASEDVIADTARRLVDALEDYNIDEAEELLKSLSGISLDPVRERTVANVKDLLLVFKYDEAADLIKKEFTE